MTAAPRVDEGLLAIDVGSSRVKLGWFSPPRGAAPPLPDPDAVLAVSHREETSQDWLVEVSQWLKQRSIANAPCAMVSVRPNISDALLAGPLAAAGVSAQPMVVADLPLEVRVAHPGRVGVDRLVNAIAARQLCQKDENNTSHRPLIVVDAGTAITVDLVAADGGFEGGAILPGASAAALTLHYSTAALPRIDVSTWDGAPTPLGKSTEEAIRAGICWGTAGGIRELVGQLRAQQGAAAKVLLTGGDGHWLATLLDDLDPPLQLCDHLTLRGIWAVAQSPAR